MYYLVKTGFYDQGVFWIGNDLNVGIDQADFHAIKDSDSYHIWELRKYSINEGVEKTKENEIIYRAQKGES